jgi:hypothetical protein
VSYILAIRGAVVVGSAAALAGSIPSVLQQLGWAPGGLFASMTRWSVDRRIGEVPVEVLVGIWFISVGVLIWSRVFQRSGPVMLAISLMAGTVIGWLVWFGRQHWITIPMVGTGLAALVLLVAASLAPRMSVDAVVDDGGGSRAVPAGNRWRRLGMVAAVGMALCSVVHVAASRLPEGEAYRRNLVRWYHRQQARVAPDLAAVVQARAGMKVLVFTSYAWQPFRSNVSERLAQITAIRGRGVPIEYDVRSFPLDPSCNHSLVGANIVNPAACHAAMAVKHVRAEQGAEAAADFEQWLYSRGTVLSRELVDLHLASVGLLDSFTQHSDALLDEVAKDVTLAKSLGVARVPTYVVNGVRVPMSDAAFLSILEAEADRWTAPSVLKTAGVR